MQIDLGDLTLDVLLRLKRPLPPGPRPGLRVGAPEDNPHTGGGRGAGQPRSATLGTSPPTERMELRMDLQADMQVPLSVEYTDEVGNPVPTPGDATVAFVTDTPSVINLTDNGDGTAVAAATGTLGEAGVDVTATSGGVTFTGHLHIVVVPGLAERVNVVPGEPTEVTPD